MGQMSATPPTLLLLLREEGRRGGAARRLRTAVARATLELHPPLRRASGTHSRQ